MGRATDEQGLAPTSLAPALAHGHWWINLRVSIACGHPMGWEPLLRGRCPGSTVLTAHPFLLHTRATDGFGFWVPFL